MHFRGCCVPGASLTDIVARIGSEEFVAVVPGANVEAALAIARSISAAFQSAAQILDGQTFAATVSVGVATNGGQMRRVADVLAAADAALYRAKNAGRNCVVLAAEERDESLPDNVIRLSPHGGQTPIAPRVNAVRAGAA